MKLYNSTTETIAYQQYHDPLLCHISDHIVHLIQSLTFNPRKNKVLDLGCGAGRTSIILSKKGYDVTGFDLEKKAIEVAKQKAKEQNLRVKFILQDITKPFAADSFDFVICQEVIEHIKNYKDVIKNAYNSLNKGGYLILSTPHQTSQWTILDDYAGHVRRFSIKEMRTELKDFDIVELYTIGFPFMRSIMFVYNQIVKKKQLKHSDFSLVKNPLYVNVYIPVLSLLLKIDDFFNFTSMGTNIIVRARK